MHTPSSPPFANMADGKVAIKKHTKYKRILHAPRLILVDRRRRLVGEEVVLERWLQMSHKKEKEKEQEKEKDEKSQIINWIPARTVHATQRLHRYKASLKASLCSILGAPAQRPPAASVQSYRASRACPRLPFKGPGSATRPNASQQPTCPNGVPAHPRLPFSIWPGSAIDAPPPPQRPPTSAPDGAPAQPPHRPSQSRLPFKGPGSATASAASAPSLRLRTVAGQAHRTTKTSA